jgi:hypothetical protein
MGFRTITLADDTCGVDYFYWNKSAGEWRTDITCHSHWANVYYWTEADPEKWVDSDPPVRDRKTAVKKHIESDSALADAWAQVEKAIEQYEIVKALTR